LQFEGPVIDDDHTHNAAAAYRQTSSSPPLEIKEARIVRLTLISSKDEDDNPPIINENSLLETSYLKSRITNLERENDLLLLNLTNAKDTAEALQSKLDTARNNITALTLAHQIRYIYIVATASWTVGAQLTLQAASLPAGQLLPTSQATVELCPCAAQGATVAHHIRYFLVSYDNQSCVLQTADQK
jgi:hypothetical protein